MVFWILSESILSSLFGILCFMGVVKSFAAYAVTNFGDISEHNLVEIRINNGIFKDFVGFGVFFGIMIIFI